MSDNLKPVPPVNADTAPYWDAAREGRLVYQRCTQCHHVLGYPRGSCPACQARSPAWHESSGGGVIASFSIVHRAPVPAFRSDSPYVLALVDFDEGFRLMMNVVGDSALASSIGDRVRVTFESRGEDGAQVPQVVRS